MSEITRNRSVLVGLVLGLLLVLGNGVFAQRVSQETARSVAETFFNYNVRDGQSQPIYLEDITAETPFQNFYIFSADSGFVLVAADERVTPILGYSKASQFVTEDMPENLKWWLESYDAQIQDVRENSAPSTSEIAIAWRNLKAGERMLSKGNRNEVLDLTTKWDQGGLTCMLYNNACPVTNSGHRCVTGCTATAIAQALKYWDYPIQGIGNKTLNAADIFFETVMHPECYPISVDFSATTYDWQNMPDQLTCSSSQAEIDAVATLMLHCGVAMHMNYGLSNNTDGGSSAPYLVDTISKYFDYSSCAFYSHRSDYSDDEWINMLKSEIDSHRPVLYRGSSAGGGHAFVFYGYDDNDMFMVNWGWSGQSDGYYAIGELNPPTTGIGGGTTYDFNENNAAIFYLMPNDRTLSPPTSFTVNNTANFNELQLVWSATLHAASYVILRNGEFLAETSSTSYIDGDIVSGSSNTYQIITIGENHRASLPSGSVTYIKPFIITTTAFPTEGGTTTGDGHYPLGESCTVTATPNPGFTFMGWYGNALGTMLYSRQPEYTFTVTRDRHLYAKFVLGNYTVTTSCSPANGGTVSGNQGTYTAGSTVTLTATANSGYVFSCWTEDGHVVSTQPIYSFTALSNRHLVANFMQPTFSLGTLITNPDGSKGVVFYINPTYTGGCMVALEDVSTDCPWGNDADVTFMRNYTYTRNECLLSDLDGYANTAMLRENQSVNPDYAPGKVDFEHGWYMPSAGQLRKIFSALPFIESTITNAGGTTLSDNGYWSSTENSESNAWTSVFEMSSQSKTSNYKVRAVRDFSINNTLHVQLRTNNAELGAVAGTDFYPVGSQVTVMAVPSGDNLFRGWTEKGHLVSQDAHYTFTVNANRELVANFAVRGGVGTLVTNPDGSQGILFHVNEDGTKGLMVALEDASEGCQWGPENDVVILKDRALNNQSILKDQSGYHNTQLIRMTLGTDNDYAASIVDFDNGWYLPSSGQLRKLYAELPLLEEAFIKAGGNSLADGAYWSSTEYSASSASTLGFEIAYTSKTSNCRVRAIRNYVIENDHVVLVAANDDSYGTVSVSEPGVFAQNQIVTVTATPSEGYQFDHWTEDGATISYDAVYQFPFTRSRSLVANFVSPNSVGSIITNADGSRGVVFYSDPSGIGGLMVALDDASEGCPWGINEDIVPLENWNPGQTQNMLEDMSGYENTWIIRNWQSNNPDYAAGKVDYSGSWFLPSAGQMRKLYAALPLIEEAIVCAGGSLMTENLYWTSSENSSNQAWSPSFEFTKTNKTTDLRVRAIRSIMPMMMITATSNPEEGGTVSGAGAYDNGATCTLTAAPNEHFAFVNWTKDGQQVSTSASYTFTVTEAADYVANFELNSYDITATANPDGGGTVTGSGTYGYGEAATLTAMANEGYSFQNWTENGEEVCAEAIYNFTVTGNRDLVANFVEEGPFIPTEDLVAYYPFDGDVNDYSGNDNHGTIIGNVVPVTDRHGNPHGAYRFPGVPFNYISVPDAEILHLNSFTLSAWVYTDAEDYGSGTLINKGRDINNGSYRLNVRGVGATTQYGGTNDASVEENPAIGQWHMITGTVEGDQARYYLDGVLLAENTLSHPFSYNNTQPLTLGVHYYEGVPSNWAYTLLGIIDEVRIYSRVFTPQEVQQLYGYEETTYDIEAVANPEEGGMVEGAGTYIEGSVCTLTAIPNENFTFTNWTRNGQMVSTTPTYSFTVIDAGSYVANFHQNICTVTVTANPSDGGTVTGSGTYDYGTQVTLTATASEGYTFVNWTANGALLSTSPTCTLTVTGDTDCVARFLSGDGVVQTGSFTSGWNWWNTYIEQGGMDGLQMLEDGLGSNGIQIKSQQQYVNYYEGMGWMGMLASINNESTYKIKTSAPCTVEMTGLETIASTHPITITPGWNWIGYPVNSSMSVATAFSNVTPASGDQVKAQNGYANYYDGMGWMGTLSTIEPGMGILYKSNGSGSFTLVYPTNSKGETLVENITSENNHWVPDMHAYPDNMTVTAIIELDDDELQSDNYELAAFADGECRGSVRLMYVEPLNRHMAFLTITGEEVTALSFSLYDTQTDEEIYGAQETLNFSNNAIVGDLREPYVLHFRGITGVDEWANRLNVFPNPVARGEVLNIVMPTEDLGEMRVEIINALGVVEACHGASLQTITAPDVAGVYTLHITVEGKGTCYRKLVVK